mgnify:CR=1 FL=1
MKHPTRASALLFSWLLSTTTFAFDYNPASIGYVEQLLNHLLYPMMQLFLAPILEIKPLI